MNSAITEQLRRPDPRQPTPKFSQADPPAAWYSRPWLAVLASMLVAIVALSIVSPTDASPASHDQTRDVER